ncbi:MAG: hypothetical protein QXU40_01415 [Candidatus Pacearchaeota archaeon]
MKGGTAFQRGESFTDHSETIKYWVESYDPPNVIVHRFVKSNIIITDWMKSENWSGEGFTLIREPNVFKVNDGFFISILLRMNPAKRDEWGLTRREASIDDTKNPVKKY